MLREKIQLGLSPKAFIDTGLETGAISQTGAISLSPRTFTDIGQENGATLY